MKARPNFDTGTGKFVSVRHQVSSQTVTRVMSQLTTVSRDEKFEDNLKRIRERYGMVGRVEGPF